MKLRIASLLVTLAGVAAQLFGQCPGAAPKVQSPADGATNIAPNVTLAWAAVSGADSYDVFIGTGLATGCPLVATATTSNTTYTAQLSAGTRYQWRVAGKKNGTPCPAQSSACLTFTTAENFTVLNTTALHNGSLGYHSHQTKNSLWQSDTSAYNNWRGAQGALYGTDAMTSVVQVWTRTGSARVPELRFGADGGNFGTANGFVSLAGARGRFDYNAFGNQYNTNGQGVNGCPCDQTADYDRSHRLYQTFLTEGQFLGFVYTGDTTDPMSPAAWQWHVTGTVADITNVPGRR